MIDLLRIAELADEYTFPDHAMAGRVGGTLTIGELREMLSIVAFTLEAQEIGRSVIRDEEPFAKTAATPLESRVTYLERLVGELKGWRLEE